MSSFIDFKKAWLFTLPLVLFASAAIATDTDCVEDGGKAVCTAPIIVPISPTVAADADFWSYVLCDEQAPFLSRAYWWCVVRGGTWDTSDPRGPSCLNAQPVFDPAVYPWSKTFEGLAHNACTTDDGPDTGWGATVSSAYCWNGSTISKNGIPITQFRHLGPFSGSAPLGRCNTGWAEGVIARRDRLLTCPQAFTARQKPNAPAGDIECFYLPPCCESVGNPINPAQGNKTLVEEDFRWPRVDGLTIVRYYNNAGFHKSTPSMPTAADFWRTTYDRRLFPIASGVTAVAAVQREDGSLQYFSPAGQEIHNISGGPNRLERLVDGTGTTAGWRHTAGSKDVELYDATGRLQSITFHSGMMHTLAYSNTSTPPAIAPYPGLLISVTDSLSRAINFAYDTQGRRTTLVDPLGQLYVYSYDGVGNLWKVTYPDLTTRVYVYGEVSNNCGGLGTACSYALMPWTLTGIIDENGKRHATYMYSSVGLAVSSQHAGGADGVFVAYAPNKATVTDALGTVRTTTYQNVQGVMKTASIAQPCINPGCTGTISRNYTYDSYGNVASQTDFNNKKICYAYDTTRNLEMARVEGIQAELCGAVLTTLPNRPDVRKVSTQWHTQLRLPTKLAEPNRITTNAYNGDGGVYCAPVAVIGALCRKTVQETSDPTGQQGVAATLIGTPRTWLYTYDGYGQVLTATDPNGKITNRVYYAANDADLGKRGNVKTITNPLGHVTTIAAYDLNGRPLSIIDPNLVVTTLTYWPRGWLDARTVAGETTTYDYDGGGQLTKVTQPDGSYLQYIYDGAHRLTQIQDGLDNKITYTLDAMGNRVKEQVFDPGGAMTRVRQQVFDSLNRLHQSVGAQ